MEKEKDFENREYFVAYLELCVLNMFENVKTIVMEQESIAFLTKERKDPNYEDNRKKELEELKKNKMEVVKLSSVINILLKTKSYLFLSINLSLFQFLNSFFFQNVNKKIYLQNKKQVDDINKINPNSKVLKDLKVMNTSTNPNCFDCIPGLNHSHGESNNVVKNFDHSQIKGSHNCTALNDQIHNKLNVREQVFRAANLPTLTLAEFAEREKARMEEQELQAKQSQLNAEDEDSDNEEAANRKTQKAREWDDWKDLNDKGSGNTKR